MKLMLVCASEETLHKITGAVQPMRFEVIHYRHVLKAMDNIDEVAPSAIIVSARDFPRHWKILVQFVRQQYLKENCPIVILKGEDFSVEDASKACCIGVNGLVPEDLTEDSEAARLLNILNRYLKFDDNSNAVWDPAAALRLVGPGDRISICITDPVNKNIIPAAVTAISHSGVRFKADAPNLTGSFQKHPDGYHFPPELCECSLRAGDAILSPVCRLINGPEVQRTAEPEISMEFSYLSGEEQGVLDRYLESLEYAG
ncbi:hypothetical protein AGMMS49991_06140 [Spirochaetia bacterium]|nr:hypothetical protein AGMMS49991_06140 [Spirochaetia bacterium]